MSYLPNGLPAPVPENDGLDKPYWEAHAPRRADGPALPEMRHVPVGAGMDLPQVPVLRHGLAQGVGQGPHL